MGGQRVSSLWNVDSTAFRRGMEQAMAGMVQVAAQDALNMGNEIVQTAMLYCPVDTGNLRRTLYSEPLSVTDTEVTIAVGASADYACIMGADTQIAGPQPRAIGRIQAGAQVFTQTGELHPVLAATRFPATEKPDLVTLAVPWRQGKDHELTVTLDHKVLASREGRNLWVAAGDLRSTDSLFVRLKIGGNKGTRQWKTCEQCERRHQRQGRRYCSPLCRDVAWAAGANLHTGSKRSQEARTKMAQAAINGNRGANLNRKLAQKGYQTATEAKVALWLAQRGVEAISQFVVGSKAVDFFVPSRREIIEADGAYRHQDQARDVQRDREILALMPGVEITHIHFWEERFSPVIDPEPLPGVRYVVCNPGPSSYVDPALFEARPITYHRSWRYEPSASPYASRVRSLFDLSVEGVHSFLANGILVSNSYVEFGTVNQDPQPFLRPAIATVLSRHGNAITVESIAGQGGRAVTGRVSRGQKGSTRRLGP